MKCKVCGEELGEGCKPKNWLICQTHYYNILTKEDWKNLYDFYRLVYFPFIHSILANADERKNS